MAAPDVTLTFTILGVNNVPSEGKIVFTLCNYGDNPPLISGTGVFAPLQVIAYAASNGTGSVTLWGNDQISPINTEYQVAVYAAGASTPSWVQTYIFDTGSYDLSTQTPVTNVPLPLPPFITPSIVAQTAPLGDYFTGINNSGTFSYANPTPGDVKMRDYVSGGRTGMMLKHAGAINSSSPTLTITALNCETVPTSAVAGYTAYVQGAGPNGSTLVTTVSTFNSATSLTLANNASTSVSAADVILVPTAQDDTTAYANASAVLTPEIGRLVWGADVYVLDATQVNASMLQSMIFEGANKTCIVFKNTTGGGFNFTALPIWFQFGTQDRGATIAGVTYTLPALITNVTVAAGTLTAAVSNSVTLTPGQQVYLQLFTTTNGRTLNDVIVTVATSSSTQFTATTSVSNFTSTADNGVATYNAFGVHLECDIANDGVLNRGSVGSCDIWGFAEAGLQLLTPNFGVAETFAVANCGAGVLLQNVSTTQSPSAFEVGGGWRMKNNYKNDFYMRHGSGMEIGMISSGNSGGSVYLYDCLGVVINSGDWETPIYRSAAIPGFNLTLDSSKSIVINSPFMLQGNNNLASQQYLAIQNTCRHITIIDEYHDSDGTFTQPTNEFTIDANSAEIFILNPELVSQTAWTDNSGIANIWLKNVPQNPSTFTGVIINPTGDTGNTEHALNVGGTYAPTANNQTVTVATLANPGLVWGNATPYTGDTFVGLHVNTTGTYTGTAPATTVDLDIDGSNTEGTTSNYAIRVVGSNQSYFGGAATVGAVVTVTSASVLTLEGTAVGNGGNGIGIITNFHAAANSDVLYGIEVVPATLNTESKTSTSFYGLYANMQAGTVTGTPANMADVVAAGACTDATNNYGFLELGSAPNYFVGPLAVAQLCTTGVSATGGNTINTTTYYAGGTVGVTAGSFSAVTAIQAKGGILISLTGTSDRRLKKAQPYKGGVMEINKIKPVKFKWNKKGQKKTGFPADQEFVGFIAQNVQSAIPQAITNHEDKERYLSMDDKAIIALCVNSIKELAKENKKLRLRVAKLEVKSKQK